ncbi:hypothetical protein Q0M94_17090 (plasmid) [Deinococcus radiomollis]|uniref:hypothetical protein n=1 Tax=Deinococcus radiomollis TaxID=468916 RepID=UPI0038923C5F
MTDPRRATAHFGQASFPGRILALEGGGGYLRVVLAGEGQHPYPEAGQEGELEMHDGARFAMVIVEALGDSQEKDAEFRMKLVDRGA